MYYGHEGQSSDNAFTTYRGNPIRTFRAFETQAERKAHQQKIWEESGHEKNLIFCTRKFLEQFYPDFYVAKDGVVHESFDTCCQCEYLETAE